MRAAIPTWNDHVSPVFDVARRLIVVDIEDDTVVDYTEVSLESLSPVGRVRRLVDECVDVLICGAISRPLERMAASVGVTVIPYTCGLVEEVLSAFLSGRLTEQCFLMPGCGRRRALRVRKRRGGGENGKPAIGCDRQESDTSEKKGKEGIEMPKRHRTGRQGKASGTGKGLKHRSGGQRSDKGADGGRSRGRGQCRGGNS